MMLTNISFFNQQLLATFPIQKTLFSSKSVEDKIFKEAKLVLVFLPSHRSDQDIVDLPIKKSLKQGSC